MSSETALEIGIPCSHQHRVKCGFRYNKNGKTQRVRCVDCGQRFVENSGSMQIRHDKKIIEIAVELSHTLSSRKVSDYLRGEYGIYVNHVTISKWARRSDVCTLCKKYGLEYNKVRALTTALLRRNELTAGEDDLPYLQFIENNFYGLCRRMKVSNIPTGAELGSDPDRQIYFLKIK